MFQQDFQTEVGLLTAIWTPKGLSRFDFSRAKSDDANSLDGKSFDSFQTGDSELQSYAQAIEDLPAAVDEYFASGRFIWDLNTLDWSGIPPFHREVLACCFKIPAGETVTYGGLAEFVGRPKAARAVGAAMAANRWPILIPCHRVVGASGKLTGYSGIGGVATKRRLLEMEMQLAGRQAVLFS